MKYIITKHCFVPHTGWRTGFEMSEAKDMDTAIRIMMDMMPNTDTQTIIYERVAKHGIEIGYETGFVHLAVEK